MPDGDSSAPTPPRVPSNKGIFGALFDFSFETFITPMLVRFVYLMGTFALALMWVVLLMVGFATSPTQGLIVLIFGPFAFLLYLAMFRMSLEFFVALVRMSEDIHKRGIR